MRALIVGLGSIGRRHARNWAALAAGEVWVCRQANRPQPEPLAIALREFHDLDEALAARPDAVIVTNPTSLHIETGCAALRVGAHVLVEKPLGHRLDAVSDLLTAANGSVLMVGYNLRFMPGLQR
ncbi:MAG TPA: Gfo/Idh/MocA family oxidoreductase, partial [Chloroflexota bacterium]|nr:Gfo/Idh/MocA family oxidoreductase [Chloroflexota bacterium]